MPKRSTATFSSEDVPAGTDTQLHVYYCKYSGQHCFITDASLASLPRRRTDGAHILDMQTHICRLSLVEQPLKLLKRSDGALERQLRFSTAGGLTVCYLTEPDGRYLYVLPDAVRSFTDASGPNGPGAKNPIPACIQKIKSHGTGKVHVALMLDEKAPEARILGIAPDAVSVAVTYRTEHCDEELLELCSRLLRARARIPDTPSPRHPETPKSLQQRFSRLSFPVYTIPVLLRLGKENDPTQLQARLPQLALLRGSAGPRSKTLSVLNIPPKEVHERLKQALANANATSAGAVGGTGASAGAGEGGAGESGGDDGEAMVASEGMRPPAPRPPAAAASAATAAGGGAATVDA